MHGPGGGGGALRFKGWVGDGGGRGGRSRSLGMGTSERLTNAIQVTLQTTLHRGKDKRWWDGAEGRRCYSWYGEGVASAGGEGDTIQGSSGWTNKNS